VGSRLGLTTEKIRARADYPTSPLYGEPERLALEYADCMTITGHVVSDELFARLGRVYDADALVELTATIARETASAKFHRALRVASKRLWRP
jgi:alkylhydroperoxidase family enzyme